MPKALIFRNYFLKEKMKKTIIALSLLVSGWTQALPCDDQYHSGRPIYSKFTPDKHVFLCRNNYEIFYSGELKNPLYAAEYLKPENMNGKFKRKNDFRPDLELPKLWRTTKSDYQGYNLDKGHLSAAENHTWSPTAMSNSFLLSNIVAQEPALNRGPWKSVESYIVKNVERGTPAYVISGPIFKGNSEYVGKNVEVPKSMFKIVWWPSKVEAWIMPNTPNVWGKKEKFETTLKEVEKQTGFIFGEQK
jgi:endonuclease G, mitochondrial